MHDYCTFLIFGHDWSTHDMLDSYTNDTPDFQLISINLFNDWSFDMKFADVQNRTYSWKFQIEINRDGFRSFNFWLKQIWSNQTKNAMLCSEFKWTRIKLTIERFFNANTQFLAKVIQIAMRFDWKKMWPIRRLIRVTPKIFAFNANIFFLFLH